jgi:putative resolvase
MKLTQWAKQEGISYMTAWRWFKKGLIPGAKQLETGTIIVSTTISNAEEKLQKIKAILEDDK